MASFLKSLVNDAVMMGGFTLLGYGTLKAINLGSSAVINVIEKNKIIDDKIDKKIQDNSDVIQSKLKKNAINVASTAGIIAIGYGMVYLTHPSDRCKNR